MAGKEVKVDAEHLGEAVRQALNDTRELTEEALRVSADKTAKEILSKTKSAAPVKTEKYKRGWSSKATKVPGRGAYGKTVFNKSRYMLTHLLQNGHGGPRPAGAKPHIPSDEETESIFIKNLESEMSKG